MKNFCTQVYKCMYIFQGPFFSQCGLSSAKDVEEGSLCFQTRRQREKSLWNLHMCKSSSPHCIALKSAKDEEGDILQQTTNKVFKDKKVVPYKSWIGNSKHQEASLAHIFVKKCIFLSFWQKADFRYHNALLDCFC